MANIRVGKLDFNDIKQSLKNYLSQQTEFTDYNFEGSNLSQLLNILAYNSHYDALAANFIANESFLDTATKRSSITSRAKELGYTPRSRRASSVTLNITLSNVLNQDVTSEVLVPAGTRFSTSVNDTSYTFVTTTPHTLSKQIVGGNIVFMGSVVAYEGLLTQNTLTYTDTDPILTIPNKEIDTSTLKVELFENGQWIEYVPPFSILTVNANSTVFMLQEGFNGFEVYFGDGVLGKKPTNNTLVRTTYVSTSGYGADGAVNFSLSSSITGVYSNTTITVTASSPSSGGTEVESTSSIKANAKNTFGTQDRAVIPSDYAALTAINFSYVKDVLAWDGSEHVPPRFGKIILCVVPTVGDVLSSSYKNVIATYLKSKSVGNIKVDFVDPEYVDIEVASTVKYNVNTITMSPYELQALVKATVTGFARDNIQRFSGTFRYSSLTSMIDNADYSILSNETKLRLSKELKPNLFSTNNFIFSFANPVDVSTFTSTTFYDGVSDKQLTLGVSNGGTIHIFAATTSGRVIYKTNVGNINPLTGEVVISNLDIATIDGLKFRVYATPTNLDLYSDKNIILTLKQENLKITAVKDIQ